MNPPTNLQDIMPPVTNCTSSIDIEAQFVTVKCIKSKFTKVVG